MSTFLRKLVKACPALPYMALGIWLAWAYISYSGTAWLSDTEMNGEYISLLYIVSTTAFAVALIASTFSVGRVKRLLAKPSFVIGGGTLAALGCLVIIGVGPYYLGSLFPHNELEPVFFLGCALSGLGTSALGLKCGELYGSLAPRKSILYAALSHIVLAFIYFTVIGSPEWQPVAGGPSLVGIVAFVGMPLFAGLAAALSFVAPHEERTAPVYRESRGAFPRSFWKLVAVTLVFSVIVVALRSALIEVSPVDATLDNTRLVMLLRMLMAGVFACAAIGIEGERFNFGKIYSVIMAAIVALIAFCPIVGVMHPLWSQIVTFVSCMFEFVLWCILAFIVYQRRISSVLVFGFGYGAFMLGSGIGWALGVFGFRQMIISNEFALYLVLAVIVLACAFLLFSEKEFDSLFEPEGTDVPSLDVLLGEGLPEEKDGTGKVAKGRFGLAIDETAKRYGLSQREKDVLRCLAMGYDSSAAAKKLQVSWNTVRTHTRNVYAKLGVHSKQDVIALVDQVTERMQ